MDRPTGLTRDVALGVTDHSYQIVRVEQGTAEMRDGAINYGLLINQIHRVITKQPQSAGPRGR